MSQFIVCTDAGLSSNTNRYFNSYGKADATRDFITTQSVKKLKAHLKKWALAPEGWRLSGSDGRTTYNVNELDEAECLDRISFPGLMQKARGMPSRSMNSPISTMGRGRFSLLTPNCLSSSASSISK